MVGGSEWTPSETWGEEWGGKADGKAWKQAFQRAGAHGAGGDGLADHRVLIPDFQKDQSSRS